MSLLFVLLLLRSATAEDVLVSGTKRPELAVLDEWMKAGPEVRKTAETKMRSEWQTWMKAHEKMFVDAPAGAGKVKRVTSDGVSDARNDVMMYSVVEAESPEAAAVFKRDGFDPPPPTSG